MAKARAICTCKTCGKEFEIERICRNRADANSWEKWAEETIDECDMCAKKRTDEEISEYESQHNLPALTGSVKQVAWAKKIRYDFASRIERDALIGLKGGEEVMLTHNGKPYRVKEWVEIALTVHSEAHWWIDNYAYGVPGKSVVIDTIEKYLASQKTDEEKEAEKEVVEEATMRPEHVTRDLVATVSFTDSRVYASVPARDENFARIAKDHGYRWNSAKTRWELSTESSIGSPEDCAAEMASDLLRGGYCVTALNPIIREKTISGDFVPSHPRVVFSSKTDKDALFFAFPRDYDLTTKIKKIGGRWESYNKAFKISLELWQRAMDFARAYDFKLTSGAEKLVEEKQKALEAALMVQPKKPASKKAAANGTESLMQDTGIIPDLEDDA